MGLLASTALAEAQVLDPDFHPVLELGPIGGTMHRWTTRDNPASSATYGHYKPRIGQWGEVRRELSDDRGALIAQTMRVQLDDLDGEFAAMVEGADGLSAADAPAVLRLASGVVAEADWPVRFTGLLHSWTMTSAHRWSLEFRSDDVALNRASKPSRVISVLDFPNALQEVVNKVVPVIFGVVNSWQGSDHGACPIYWVGDVAGYTNCGLVCLGGATYVPRVYVDGATIASAGNYDLVRVTINGTRYTLIDFAIDRSESDLTCDVYGLSDTVGSSGYVGPNDGNGDLIRNPVTAMRRYLINWAFGASEWREGEFASESGGRLDVTSWDTAEQFFEWQRARVGKWIGDARRPIEHLNEWADDLGVKLFWTCAGKLAVHISDPHRTTVSYSGASTWTRWVRRDEETEITYELDSRERVSSYRGEFANDPVAGSAAGALSVRDTGISGDASAQAQRPWSEYAPPFEAGFFGTVAGNQLWIEARLLDSALSPGDAVTTANDESPNGYSMTGAGGARPTLLTGRCNGRPVLDFDGSDDFLTSNTSFIASDVWAVGSKKVVAVFRLDAAAAAAANMDDNAAIICDDSGLFGVHVYQSGGLYYVAGFNYDGSRDSVSVEISLGTWYVVRVWHVDGVLSISVNGALPTTTASGNTTSLAANVIVGRNRLASPVFFNGQLAGVWCFDNGTARNEDWFAIHGGAADEYAVDVVV